MFHSQEPCLYTYIYISDDGRHVFRRYKIRWIDCSYKHDLSVSLTSATNLAAWKTERIIQGQISKTSANTLAMSLDNKDNTPNTPAPMCQRNYIRMAGTRSLPRADWHLSFWTWRVRLRPSITAALTSCTQVWNWAGTTEGGEGSLYDTSSDLS